MMTKIYKKITIVLILTLFVFASVIPCANAMEVVSPNKLPELITMSYYGVDGTQMAFNWSTTDFCESDLQVVENTGAQPDFSNAQTFKGNYYQSQATASDGWIHTCVAKNLKLNTKYYYRLGDAEFGAWSEVGSFVTESGNADKFSFIHVSDPQTSTADGEQYYSIYNKVLATATQNTPDARFVINTGDIVNNSWTGYIPDLAQWHYAITDTFGVMKNYPLMAVAGNHEAADFDFATRFHYDAPANSDKTTGVYYSFNYNNVHFIALNSNDTTNPKSKDDATGLSKEQYDWLVGDLDANKDAQWIVVLIHKGIYDAGTGANNTDGDNYDIAKIREQCAPLFTQYGVDLVLQGHDHLYSKSHALTVTKNGNALTEEVLDKTSKYTYDGAEHDFYFDPQGTIYLNSSSASGWKLFDVASNNRAELIDQSAKGEVMYSSITVDNNLMLVTTYRLNSTYDQSIEYHTFGIAKGVQNQNTNNQGGSGNQNDQTQPQSNGLIVALIVGGSVLVVAGVTVAVVLIIKNKKAKSSQE